jgi:hypothetical protein
VTLVGAPGTVEGVTPDDAVDKAEFPFRLWAVTLKVYDNPFVRPVTVPLVLENVEPKVV